MSIDISFKQLHEQFNTAFNEQELRDLCFYLKVSYENLPASTPSDKARELILRMQRENRLAELLTLVREERPLLAWPTLLPTIPSQTRPIPPLLPYLMNREIQELRIEDALRGYLPQQPKRPFLCVLYGDRHQGHLQFTDRILNTMPEKLGFTNPQAAPQKYTILWPKGIQPAQFQETLQKFLIKEISQSAHNSLSQLVNDLAHYATPVVIRIQITFDEWKQGEQHSIHQFFNFWQEWPSLAPNQYLFVFLIVRYAREESKGRLPFFRKSPLHEQIAKALGSWDTAVYPHIRCLILPELQNVTEDHADKWATLPETRHVFHGRDVFADIHHIFDAWRQENNNDEIPMETLAKKLDRLMQQYNPAFSA